MLVLCCRRALGIAALSLKVGLLRHTHACFSTLPAGMELKAIVSRLEEIAPSGRAEEWDNVGLLVEPSRVRTVERILLTNDLTEEVMEEAENLPGRKVGLIVSYHPPIFRPLKRLTQNSAKERIILRAIESQIAVYSPHTAHDSMEGGVNDWLLSGVGAGTLSGLRTSRVPQDYPSEVTVQRISESADLKVLEDIETQMDGVGEVTSSPSASSLSTFDARIPCTEKGLTKLLPFLKEKLSTHNITITARPQVPVLGGGRLLTLPEPSPLSTLIDNIKTHLKLPYVRVARPQRAADSDPRVSTVAACVGSGASVLRGVRADVYLTGELSHHDVLEAISRGTVVILCEHSNTERGFLQVFKRMLEGALSTGIEITISQVDKDPLQIV